MADQLGEDVVEGGCWMRGNGGTSQSIVMEWWSDGEQVFVSALRHHFTNRTV
jgi:hypothetical protein